MGHTPSLICVRRGAGAGDAGAVLLEAREARKLGWTRTALNIPLMPQRAWCSRSLELCANCFHGVLDPL
jgi:hypothetical protein